MDKNLLDLYSDYLLSSFGATTATGLSALVDGQISHDQITRFLSQADYTSKELWHQVKPVVRTMEREDGVLIFDDTIQEKPHTDENELICWHFDHSKNRSVKGLNLLNCVYHAGADQSGTCQRIAWTRLPWFLPVTVTIVPSASRRLDG